MGDPWKVGASQPCLSPASTSHERPTLHPSSPSSSFLEHHQIAGIIHFTAADNDVHGLLLEAEDHEGFRCKWTWAPKMFGLANFDYFRMIENKYLGLRNGILDPSAILLSRSGYLTFMDCKGFSTIYPRNGVITLEFLSVKRLPVLFYFLGQHLLKELYSVYSTNVTINVAFAFPSSRLSSRIINVNSIMHYVGFVDTEDMNMTSGKKKYTSLWGYSNSKLAQVKFSSILYKRIHAEAGINVLCVSPRIVHTKVARDLPKIVIAAYHLSPYFIFDAQEGCRFAMLDLQPKLRQTCSFRSKIIIA
uniref:Uncharacterized protein n=1 Tax=Ananas comosus var. bracteatus TaxID=296719 RepID=A0A6V7PNR6_ANACO|nr:unnamed protein product [Ananas comosus var. bracteatus]